MMADVQILLAHQIMIRTKPLKPVRNEIHVESEVSHYLIFVWNLEPNYITTFFIFKWMTNIYNLCWPDPKKKYIKHSEVNFTNKTFHEIILRFQKTYTKINKHDNWAWFKRESGSRHNRWRQTFLQCHRTKSFGGNITQILN